MTKEQFGFLENHQILDVVEVVRECIHSVKVKNLEALVLEVDLLKSYDRVAWGFLRLVLLQIGLGLEVRD